MDLRTLKDKLEALGSNNNHLEVYAANNGLDLIPIFDAGIFEKDDDTLAVVIGNVPGKFEAEKTNAAGKPISGQRHELPDEQVGRVSELPKPVIVPGDGMITSDKELPVNEPASMSNEMINAAGVKVEDQKKNEEFNKLFPVENK